MDFLNNREIAIALWLVAIAIYIFSSSKMRDVRKSLRNLLSAFFARQIISVLILMTIYMGVVVYWMFEADLWNSGQIKNTIFWLVAVGFMSFFKLESIKKDKSFFKHSVIDNLKILAIIQFVVSVYSFPLWIELLLVLILALTGGMHAIAETDEKYNQVKKLLEGLMIFFGITIIVYTACMLIISFNEFGQASTAYDFFVPPLLTLFYLPFIFMVMVYSTYEQAFVRLMFAIKENKLRLAAKTYAILFFNFRLALIERWLNHISREKISSHKELINSFKHIRKLTKLENSVNKVPFEEGWSPYIAKDFLSNEGLATGHYNKLFDNEWHASSPMVDIGKEIIPDNIAYYVEGIEGIAKVLKIKLNINDSSRTHSSREKLLALAETLIQKSLNMDITESTKNALLAGKPNCESYGIKSVSVAVDCWRGHKFNGHDITFIVSGI
ncbi:hypothetical protein [Stutzerimonas nitrititolerans]|uniref:hypothetical protein n=1 Tax=Stutzerimonas nitrititolerans TaxID=2482751 RepID=UPI002897A601|nr:hypothetical protein [Stutzerimonas nitrititolerans]